MIRSLAAVLAAFALAGAASAQEIPLTAKPAGPPEPPSEAAEAEAARLITGAGAGDLFDDASQGDIPGARHRLSGLVCTFEPGVQGNRIMVFPSRIPRGDDVGCTTVSKDIILTVYATRYPGGSSGPAEVDGAVQAIRQRFPDATPYSGETTNADISAEDAPPDMPEYHRARLAITVDGKPLLTKVSVVQVGPWTYKQRTTGPAELGTDLYSEITFLGVLMEIPESGRAGKKK